MGLDIDEDWLSRFPLEARGRYIVDRRGDRFRLKGTNWYGASDVQHVVGGLRTQRLATICATVRDLGFSVVRLPFSNEMLRSEVPAEAIDYAQNPELLGKTALEVYDEVVRCLGRHSVAVIVNNHTTYGEFCGPPSKNSLWFDPGGYLSETQWLEDWAMVARRYSRCPHVVGYDLRNEIRPRVPLIPFWRGPSKADGAPEGRCNWARVARGAADRLLEICPNALIVVERIVWPQHGVAAYCADPGALMPRLKGRLVLGVHMYQWSGPGRFIPRWAVPKKFECAMGILRCFGCITKHNYGDMAPAQLKAQAAKEWGCVLEAGTCPIWVSEFGAGLENEEEMSWLRRFVDILAEYDVDWAYWPLNVGPKPECGSDEIYGMLAPDWKPKAAPSSDTGLLDADERLQLLQKIGLKALIQQPQRPLIVSNLPARASMAPDSCRARGSSVADKNPLTGVLGLGGSASDLVRLTFTRSRQHRDEQGGLRRVVTAQAKLSMPSQASDEMFVGRPKIKAVQSADAVLSATGDDDLGADSGLSRPKMRRSVA